MNANLLLQLRDGNMDSVESLIADSKASLSKVFCFLFYRTQYSNNTVSIHNLHSFWRPLGVIPYKEKRSSAFQWRDFVLLYYYTISTPKDCC